MKVMVTGCDGYIGCMLVKSLLDQGYQVIGVDTGYYRVGWLYNGIDHSPEIFSKDIRHLNVDDMTDCDAVVHLAELSNDPLAQNNPEVTYKINYHGSVHVATTAKAAGVKRFIYTSSCSVYGLGSTEPVDETSPTHPQTAYAECKALVEKAVSQLASDTFTPVFLRNATVYGPSPRQRLDVVLNNLCGLAYTTKKINLTSDGTPWRPLVHVLDVCQAIIAGLKTDKHVIENQVINVGSNQENYQVKDIAEIVGTVFPDCEISFGRSNDDRRSYKVNFDKISQILPGWKAKYTAMDGAKQLLAIFDKIMFDESTFNHRGFIRLKQLKYLIQSHQLDANFFWRQDE